MKHAYSTRFDEALAFTAAAFRGRFRKGTRVPYLTHLLAVSALVGEGGGDEELQIAGLLHDWLEDIPGATEAELLVRFGPRVTRIVVACSDCLGSPKPPWRARKEAYVRHLYQADPDVKLISVADKLHNCRSTVVDVRLQGHAAFERFNAKREGTLWYYQALVPALASDDWDHWLLDALRSEVAELVKLGG